MSKEADVPVRLGPVQETLLIPLYLRAKETQRRDGVISDSRAVQIVDQLNYDFRRFDKNWRLQLDVAIRTEIFDELVLDFLSRHPDGLVVNLGAGLDGRFDRLDNGRMSWVDIDLPDAIALRRQFFSETTRNRFLAVSALDFSWFDQLPETADSSTLFIAEGLLCYFQPQDVAALFAEVSNRRPGSEIVFQSISPEYVGREGAVPGLNQMKAQFRWGIRHGKEIETWGKQYRCDGEWAFIDRHRRRWRWLRPLSLLPPVYEHLRAVMKISRICIR